MHRAIAIAIGVRISKACYAAGIPMLRPASDGRTLPITLSGLFDIERAKPGDEHAAVQVEDLCWLTDRGWTS